MSEELGAADRKQEKEEEISAKFLAEWADFRHTLRHDYLLSCCSIRLDFGFCTNYEVRGRILVQKSRRENIRKTLEFGPELVGLKSLLHVRSRKRFQQSLLHVFSYPDFDPKGFVRYSSTLFLVHFNLKWNPNLLN